ncbi:MAG: type IV secretion system DNA-binding domain-containing protein [Sandarakinorhabdus limnophila]|nr:type IV secretion system DNA-binding domain-containing protein [Sandarakinorhabdus limnophila]MCM0033949.1 type IV secretion system DNA-binding domain-containing protein [Sandarakinorhabdus limnophila]
MNRIDDRHSHAQALWGLRIRNQTKRIGFAMQLLLASTAVGAFLLPTQTLDKAEIAQAFNYGTAKAFAWFARDAAVTPKIRVRRLGQTVKMPVDEVVADPVFSDSADLVIGKTLLGAWLGFMIGGGLVYFLIRNIRKSGDQAFQDRVIGGTQIVGEAALAALTEPLSGHEPLKIGRIAVPSAIETRHFAMIGTTGSGKTTVLRQTLDCIEARGEAAIVYDTSGEFIAHYYRPERGDIILNPFDDRCAYWSPFDEIAHPADADRIAHQLISETGSHDDDVWLETSRILVANMLRALWSEGNCSLEALLDALQTKDTDELKRWLGGTSSARTFAEGAERATGSVIFMLAKAANLIQFLRSDGTGGEPFAFRRYIVGLDTHVGERPWIFVPRKEDYFEAAKPLLACWLECAASAALGLPPSPNRRIWLILDELADLPAVQNLARLLPEGRKFGAAITLTFQALGQMRHRYGDNIAEAMLACCNTKLFLQTVDQETRKWASQTIGECEIEMRMTADMLSLGGETPRTTMTTVRQVRAAVLESELRLPKHQGYLLLPDGLPVARIGLTADHITWRGAAAQPAFVAGDVGNTLWGRKKGTPAPPPPTGSQGPV